MPSQQDRLPKVTWESVTDDKFLKPWKDHPLYAQLHKGRTSQAPEIIYQATYTSQRLVIFFPKLYGGRDTPSYSSYREVPQGVRDGNAIGNGGGESSPPPIKKNITPKSSPRIKRLRCPSKLFTERKKKSCKEFRGE